MMSVVGGNTVVLTREEYEAEIAQARDLAYDQGQDVQREFTAIWRRRAEVAEHGLAEATRAANARADAAEAELAWVREEYDRLLRGMAMAAANLRRELRSLQWARSLMEGRTVALALAQCLGDRSWRRQRCRAVWVGLTYPTEGVKAIAAAACAFAGGIVLALALTGFGG